MADTVYDTWMSDSDALMWNIERDPQLRSTVTSVWLLDAPPDRKRFQQMVERAVDAIPRLRQRVASDPLRIAPPRWQMDPHFDVGFHLRRLSAGGGGTLRTLLDLAEPIAMQAFDKDRPLWEFYLVDGLEGGRAGILMKIHHAMSDGVGMVRMTESLVARDRDSDPRPRAWVSPPRDDTTIGGSLRRTGDALARRLGAGGELAARSAGAIGGGLRQLVSDPVGSARRLRDVGSSIGRLLEPVSEPLSPVLRGRSLSMRFDALEADLAEMKRVGKEVGGTLNDSFVGAVTGGLRRYHEALGRPVEELRMNMPINVREGSKGRKSGNQFAPARFTVPIGIADPRERMRALGGLARSKRSEPALPLIDGISGMLNRLPPGISANVLGSMMKAVDFVTSNVPGPPFPVYTAGSRILAMYPFGPLAGVAVNVTLFSYDGTCTLGINMDGSAVKEPELFVDCMRKGLDEVLSIA